MPKIRNVRSAVNEILPGKLYQRGQILTWQRAKKYTMLEEYGVRTVVNFWPKMDPDMAEAPLDNYLLLACPRSEQMLEDRIEQAAKYVAGLVATAPALILCEAGVTRSVYFCALTVAELLGKSPLEALEDLQRAGVGTDRLKGFMQRRLKELST